MSWHNCTLGEVVRFQRGHDLPDQDRKPGDVPVIGSAGLTGWHNEARAKGPGVSIGRSGASIGKVTYTPTDYWPHNACLYVTDFLGNCPRFIYYYLRTKDFTSLNSGAAQPSLNRNFVHALPARIAETRIQENIVDVLSAYDDLIENNQRRIALLEEAARLLYREWFVYFRFPGHEHVKVKGGVPEGWSKVAVSDVVDVLSGGTPKTAVPSYWDGPIPFFTPKDTTETPFVFETEKTITEEGLRSCNSQLYPPDTLFITARGTVGKLNLTLVPMAMNQSCYALKAKVHVQQRYIYLALKAAIEQVRSKATGAVFDAIIVATFDTIPFLLPPERLAQSFTLHIQPIFDQMANLVLQNKRLTEARDILLPRLMNGEIAV